MIAFFKSLVINISDVGGDILKTILTIFSINGLFNTIADFLTYFLVSGLTFNKK